jgi:hypothetical protein
MMIFFLYAAGLIFATTFIHAACTVVALGWARSSGEEWILRNGLTRAAAVSALVLLMSVAACLESLLWASLYVIGDALPDLGTAFYFSLVTFTTLGYGDVTLAPGWRVLGAIEAANGTIMFGWTTALIVAFVQRAYFREFANK